MANNTRSPPTMPTVAEVVAAHGDLVRKGGGWAGPCPVCSGDDRFHLKDRGDGTALIGCRGCIDNESPDVQRKAWGAIMGELFPDRAMPRSGRRGGRAEPPGDSQPKSREGLGNVLTALGFDWRWNLRAQRAELRNDAAWCEATDHLVCDIRSQIPERFVLPTGNNPPLAFGRTAFEDCFSALLNRAKSDPFVDWLESLPPWHGERRLDQWIGHVFTVRDGQDSLAAWGSRSVLLGAVWRAYQPGTKHDEMLVLIGPQGIGKSTSYRHLLPPEHPEWFSDGLMLSGDDKRRAEALQGRVIVEAGEMAGATRAERESLKAFLSRTDDGSVRLAYRRNPETQLRRSVLVGSTNDPHCLPPDPSGNRRFVALTVGGGVSGTSGAAGVRGYLHHFRDQLWAEALHRYVNGEPAHLPDELKHAQTAANTNAVQVDESLETAVLDYLEGLRDEGRWFRLQDLKARIRPVLGDRMPSDKRLGVELQRLDCESIGKARHLGQHGRWWVYRVPDRTG